MDIAILQLKQLYNLPVVEIQETQLRQNHVYIELREPPKAFQIKFHFNSLIH